ncbi:MAG: PD-(D/E)XK nuclease family protein [Erysipelotrichaceae bacterium]|nr:PD-(D/E)XK nuclease family protein [Erysipelotrichaceae bacterium]
MDKRFVIAPYAMHEALFSYYRQNDAFQDVKIISKESFLDSVYEHLSLRAIKEIMISEKCEATVAASIARILPFIIRDESDAKLHYLYLLKNKLKALDLVSKDNFLSSLYKRKKIDIYGYSPLDIELSNGLNNLYCQTTFHLQNHLSTHLPLLQFSSSREETLFCLNRIASLIDQGVDPSNIYIYSSSEEYLYYLQEFQGDFHFSINLPSRVSLYSQDFVCRFLKCYSQNHDLEIAFSSLTKDEITSRYLDLLQQVINEVKDERFSFDEQYHYLVSFLKKTYLDNDSYSPSINFIEEPTIIQHAHVFVLGFREGVFPLSYQDSDYLSDRQKEIIGLNTSLIKGKISEQLLINFFSQENTYYFTYSETYLTNTYHPSPLAKSWMMEKEIAHLPTVFYAKKYAQLIYASLSDRYKFYQEKTSEYLAFDKVLSIPYDTYDNQYSFVSAFNDHALMEHSYSDIKSYCACPFQYYLLYGLKLDPFLGNFFSALGNIAHHILKNITNPHFDFEEAFAHEISQNSYAFKASEKVFLERLKEEIKIAVEGIKIHQEQYMDEPHLSTEKFLRVNIDPLTIIKGFIDKIIVVDDQYLFLVDYKTGKETFHPRLVAYGDSLQLPTYAYLVSQSLEFQDYTLAGLYIQHLLPPSWKENQRPNDIIPSYLKLDGLSFADGEALAKIDTSFSSQRRSSFIKGVTQKDGLVKESGRVVKMEEINRYKDVALALYQDANQKIRSNVFPVYPTILGKNSPCQNCSFHDICFVKYEQKHFVDIEEEEDESSGI